MIKTEATRLDNGWTKYPPNKAVFPYANCFYQKRIWDDPLGNDEHIYAEIVEYPEVDIIPMNWELQIYIRNEHSLINKALKIHAYSYFELDFEQMEKDARKLLLHPALIRRKRVPKDW